MKAIDVAAALIFDGGKLLITQRRAGDHLEHLWEFPGGKVECDETFESCLAREIREELGIEIAVGPMIEQLTHAYPEKEVHLRFFACELMRGEPQAIACQACKWVTKDDLMNHDFPAADAHLLERLMAEPWPLRG